MAEQDFQINIRTLADLTGIKLTQQQLDALQKAAAEGNQKAIAALKQLADAQKKSQADLASGFTGSAIGVGTIIGLVTGAISKWQAFNAEQDRMVEKMIETQGKLRELGNSIIDVQDKMIDAARRGALPLKDQLTDLQQEFARLKTEQSLLNLPQQGEEWKKLQRDINETEGAINKVTSAMKAQDAQAERSAAAKEKAAQKEADAQVDFMANAVATATPQVQSALQQEDAARRARQAGLERDADLYQKSAEAFKSGFTPAQREEYEGLTKPVRLGPKAGAGESQAALDEIERNRINFERQLKGEPPLPQGDAAGNQKLIDAINQLKNDLVGIWR